MVFLELSLFIIELPITLFVALISVTLMVAALLAIPVECAITYLKQRNAHNRQSVPPSETQPPKKPAVKRADRKITPQRKKKCIPSYPVEDARAKRRQAMIAACDQAEQRLRAGRERALETRRALDKIWKRVALELKESDKKSKEVFSSLIARQREKQKEMHDWLESAAKASREFSKKLREELKVDTSVGGQGLKEMKLCPASQSGEEDRTKSSSRAAGLAEKLGKECSELNEGENTTALEKSVQGVKCEKDHEIKQSFLESAKEMKEKEKQVCRTLGDTKTIKMKFGKNNKLACIMEKSIPGDGFYVDL